MLGPPRASRGNDLDIWGEFCTFSTRCGANIRLIIRSVYAGVGAKAT